MTVADFNPSLLAMIKAQAEKEYPRECCGFVIQMPSGGDCLLPIENVHSDPTQCFQMPEDAQWKAEKLGEVLAIYHSHPDEDSKLSPADIINANATCVPWLVYALPANTYEIYVPEGWIQPLYGRRFVHGAIDCYSAIRDYFKQECSIVLPQFQREDDWWSKGQNLYVDHFAEAGFIQLFNQPLKKHDALLMNILSKVPNHGAVYVGEGFIYHHMYGRFSEVTKYGGIWLKNTCLHLRHKTLC